MSRRIETEKAWGGCNGECPSGKSGMERAAGKLIGSLLKKRREGEKEGVQRPRVLLIRGETKSTIDNLGADGTRNP